MRNVATIALTAVVASLAVVSLCSVAGAQVPLTGYGVPAAENFNTLASTGTSSVVPTGWAFLETGTNANALYSAGTGSNNAADTYSFGAALSAERAFGGLRSGTLVPTIGASFVNSIGGPIGRLDIEYVGEEWRLGTLGRLDKLDFQYSLNAVSLNTGTWTDVDALDFIAPVTGPTIGALDGNAAANRTLISAAISGLSLAPTAVIWIRWTDFDGTGADDGLGVDDFQIIPREPPVPVVPVTLGAVKGTYR
jgi:hypothetical protein